MSRLDTCPGTLVAFWRLFRLPFYNMRRGSVHRSSGDEVPLPRLPLRRDRFTSSAAKPAVVITRFILAAVGLVALALLITVILLTGAATPIIENNQTSMLPYFAGRT